MKIKWGALVVDGRGKVGGHVAAKNRGGAYLRTKVTPTNPNSTAQAAVRNRLTALAQAWRGLPDAKRASWNAAVSNFAKTDIFADIKIPSGINLFTKLNSNLMEVSEPTLTTAPLPSSVEAVETVVVTATASVPSMSLAFTPDPVPAGHKFIIKASAQMSAGVSNFKGKMSNIDILEPADASPANILTAYTTKFGTLVAGQKIGFEVIPVNYATGQKGQGIFTTVVVGA